MTQKPGPDHSPTPEPEQAGELAAREDAPETPATELEEEGAVPAEGPDPYDDLWDPDMDTRPERIKRTKTRPRMDSRSRGRVSSRGKRREEA